MIHGIPAISIPYDVFPGEKVPEEKRYILLSYVQDTQITYEMFKDTITTVSHLENAPYAYTLKRYEDSEGSDKLRETHIKTFEKYNKTKVEDYNTSVAPFRVFFDKLEYLTVEPRKEISNDGCGNSSTPVEIGFNERESIPNAKLYMNVDCAGIMLPLYERIRRNMYKAITNTGIMVNKGDYEDVKTEYDELFGKTIQEQILPTVHV